MTLRGSNPIAIGAHAVARNIAIWMTVIAAATLLPSADRDPGLTLCLICGERGAADAIANLVLFFPLGYALAHRSGPATLGKYSLLGLPLLISLGVEILQIAIPGRNPSLSDLVFNSLGGWLGYWAGTRSIRRGRTPARLAWWVGAGTSALILMLTALLVAPAPTHGVYFGQWTAEFDDVQYDGRVLQAFVGDQAIADAHVQHSSRIRRALLAGEPIRVLALAGPPPDRLAALFSIADQYGVFNLFIGIDHDDIVFDYRTRANVLRLDQLRLRARELAGGLSTGDTLRLNLTHRRAGLAFWLNGVQAQPGVPHLGMGWQLLFGSTAFPPWLDSWLNLAWIAVCVAPIGRASADFRRMGTAAALIILLLIGLPGVSWLAASPPSAYLAVLAGLTAGALLRINPDRAASQLPG